MTHDEMIAVIQAHKEGKTIQVKTRYVDEWTDCEGNEPLWDFDDYEYRVKPDSKYRPYESAEECLEDMKKHSGWVKDEYAIRHVSQITFKEKQGLMGDVVQIRGCNGRTYKELLKEFTYADDGTPCGVKEEE